LEEDEVVVVPIPVIRARVVRSVSLGRDEPVGGAWAKREAEEVMEAAVVEDSEPSPGPAKPDPEIVLPTLAPSAEADSRTVDERRISHPRTVGLRA